MKKALLYVAICSLLPAFAVDRSDTLPVKPEYLDEFNAKTGGLVDPPADGKVLVMMDARTKDNTSLSNMAESVAFRLSLKSSLRRINVAVGEDLLKVALAAKAKDAGAVIVFYEKANFPVLSVYPEEAIALINVSPLKDPDHNAYNRRLVKEFWRALGLSLGAYGGVTVPPNSFQPVFSLADLDAIQGFGLPPIGVNTIFKHKAKLKLHHDHAVPYSRACREGWAPQPTNAVQRTIYDRCANPVGLFNRDFKKGK